MTSTPQTLALDQQHVKCLVKPSRPQRQARIVLTPQSIRFERSPIQHPRSPTPNAVRRITHAPFFSTTDQSLTSFLRFPYDIRRQIYVYLLSSTDQIRYGVCVPTRRLVMTRYRGNHPYERHGIFPAILECCRLTHDEGAPILYGHNGFQVQHCGHDESYRFTYNSWPVAESSMKLMAKLEIYHCGSRNPPGQGCASLLYHRLSFPVLREAKIDMTMGVTEWESFLEEYADCLSNIPSLEFSIDMREADLRDMWRKHGERNQDGHPFMTDYQTMCLQPYQAASLRFVKLLRKRETWHWWNFDNEYGPSIRMMVRWEDSRF